LGARGDADALLVHDRAGEHKFVGDGNLMKVVNDLSQKGYLDTVRDRNGGIRLLREPEDINIGQSGAATPRISSMSLVA
jgi:Rrf2 family transcriptional regulator, nitric oxide-sensitive transcriptional repressor